MEIHHDKHHGAYVTNLNKALDGHADLQKLSVEELLAQINKVPENIRVAVRNNGGGHMNHSMFWKIMKKGGGGEPGGDLGNAINSLSAPLPISRTISIKRPQRVLVLDGLGCYFRRWQADGDQLQPGQSRMDGGKAFVGLDVGNTPTT